MGKWVKVVDMMILKNGEHLGLESLEPPQVGNPATIFIIMAIRAPQKFYVPHRDANTAEF